MCPHSTDSDFLYTSRQDSSFLPVLCHGISNIKNVVDESKLMFSFTFTFIITAKRRVLIIMDEGIFVYIHVEFTTRHEATDLYIIKCNWSKKEPELYPAFHNSPEERSVVGAYASGS